MKEVHILLVEDNEGDIVLTQDAFEECKVKTTISVVRNGQQALDFMYHRGEYAHAEKPDLILLDLNIPIFNGHEVLRQLKSDDQHKRIPVIMLTTSSNPKDISLAYENHGNSYIKKPLDMDEFLKAVLKIEEFWLQLAKLPE